MLTRPVQRIDKIICSCRTMVCNSTDIPRPENTLQLCNYRPGILVAQQRGPDAGNLDANLP